MAVTEETGGATVIDETYEFSAPRFFDFVKGESDEESRKAELWFDSALSYAPSPFMPKIKTGRSITVDTLCDFSEADKMQKMFASVDNNVLETNVQQQSMTTKTEEDEADKVQKTSANVLETNIKPQSVTTVKEDDAPCPDKERSENDYKEDSACLKVSSGGAFVEVAKDACTPKPALLKKVATSTNSKKTHNKNDYKEDSACLKLSSGGASVEVAKDACTPKPALPKKVATSTNSKKTHNKKMATNTKTQLKSATVKSVAGTPHLVQENQAIKRQKLDEGKSRQIMNVKHQTLPHNKSKLGLTVSTSTSKSHKEDRKVYVRETPATPASVPFVSMAEMMKKFQSSTRDLSLPIVVSHTKPKLTLTRPKEPEFETSQRIRPARVKSSAELEEEMMAKIPKFKARPLNKKILQTATLPPVPRSTPQLPEFKEFHLETLARAHQNADTASIASTEVSHKESSRKPYLTEPKTPLLQTSLRARPPKVKSSLELEQEELEKAPKFKARPLNKKIFESKGDIGVFCHTKKHVTEPQEFHFATDERIPPPAAMADLFGKLSMKSEPARNHNPIPRNTTPNPFHLHTEERGAEKEKKLVMDLLQKQWEEENARIPKANPYPYTTDYPVIPPKPEPKQCTRPEPFQLESLVRHEEEIQKEHEERHRTEREEAQMRAFKAQPILKEDPIPLPEKVRKPLTQVQEFSLHVNHRAVDRAQFDERIKEKEMMYKRYREESEAARMIEEEKALKQMRRTMVPHARPVPNFDNPFCPQKSSKDITKPKSPNLRVLHRKERRKVFNGTVFSSPAANMR
ncbi:protein TPX2-like isoform X3 [Glycine soja]|uniref:Protein TPX2 n=1 Tax=Glycine soja TaxID=3848 RepID=A0A445HNV7_GLYSO|nr:protein TPX2-like isoform X1 [Glycine soja]XP_028192921.1 protein TPX2-like isoform X2 [Glycine soja]XP_028192922.1 protein TPX2-like isoform X3 [Glycine soja]RZB75431.1 Protein TPX2 [Glycine soja]